MSDSFCVLPWIHQAVRNNGTVRVCCQTNQGPEKGLLKKNDSDYFNAGADSLDLARNADLLKDLRLKMLRGEWSPECVRCRTEEATGIRSRRIYEQQQWSEFQLHNARELTSNDGSIDIALCPVLFYDLRFGNKCNLKCRSCHPTDSSAWYEDFYKLWGQNYQDGQYTVQLVQNENQQIEPKNNIYDWYEADIFWAHLEKNSEQIKKIYIVGGEPLLIKEHYSFLEKCIQHGYAKNIELEYNTNGTILPESVFDLWTHFKKVRIGVSIDGVDEINNFIRYPSKWAQIQKNLARLDESPENIVVWIAHTVMALNISQLPDFIIWRIRANFKKINYSLQRPVMSAHPLHTPIYLNSQSLSGEKKRLVLLKFEEKIPEIIRSIENSIYDDAFKIKLKEHSLGLLNQYAEFMQMKDLSQNYDKFIFSVERLNTLRKQVTPTALQKFL